MVTVLFVLAMVFLFSEVISLTDNHRIRSTEVGSYLHYEYNMSSDVHPTLTQLRNI